MNTSDLATFNEAVQKAQAGQKTIAYSALKTLVKSNPGDTNILLWIAFTTSDLSEAETAIGMASEKEPNNPNVIGAREWLAREKRKQESSVIISESAVFKPTLEKRSTSKLSGGSVPLAVATPPHSGPVAQNEVIQTAIMQASQRKAEYQQRRPVWQPQSQQAATLPMAYWQPGETVAPSGQPAVGFWRFLFIFGAWQAVYGILLGFVFGLTSAISRIHIDIGTNAYGVTQYYDLPDYPGAVRNVVILVFICGILTISSINTASRSYGRIYVNFPVWALALCTPFGIPLWMAERDRLKHDFGF